MANTFKFGAGKWAAKEGSVLAYNDENDNFKPLPFTFTRASTATRVNESGLIESVASGVPRIDYLDNADGHLLLEPSRTNVQLYSQEFDNASWSKISAGVGSLPVVTANYAISPDGTQNADRIQFSLGGGTTVTDRSLIRQLITAQTDYYFSCYIKSTDGSEQKLLWNVGGDESEFTVTNEWQRFELNKNGTTTGSAGFSIRGSISTVDTADVLVYGFQVERGSYATSYIPTSGAAVTRAKDVSYQTPPSSIINQDEGTLYVEFNVSTGEGIGGIVEIINPSSATNRVLLWDASSGSLINLSANFGAKSAAITKNNISLGTHKAALTYNSTLTKFFLDGVKIGESQSNASYTGISKIDLENIGGTVNFQQKRIKEVKLYTTALSESELIALTS